MYTVAPGSQRMNSLGTIHSTKISGNFGLKLNGSVRSNRKSFEKVVHLSRWTSFFGWTCPIEMDCSIWPFRPNLNPRSSLFGIFHVQNGGKYLSRHFYGLLTADLSVLLVHPCTVTTGLVASQAKCMFWLLTALKDDLFPERICNVFFVIRFEDFD